MPSAIMSLISLLVVVMILVVQDAMSCQTLQWRNWTMEELMIKSDIVVYGKDVSHGKFRLPTQLDARFDVYCVIKKGKNRVPSQVIIENIDGGDECSGVQGQTVVGQEYIIGLTREISGFTSYANINPPQKTAFSPTTENINKMAAACDLDKWSIPETGNQGNCPNVDKPRFCTKVRFPEDLNAGIRDAGNMVLIFLSVVLIAI